MSFEVRHGCKDGRVRVQGKPNKKGDNVFTLLPVSQEGIRGPPALDHDDKGVNSKEE